jgi:hypothetical protein
MKLTTDIDDPNLARPNEDKELPTRAKLRNDSELPR